MVNQIPISAKIYADILDDLNQECYVSGRKRNAVINIAIARYITQQDDERRNNLYNSIPGSSSDDYARDLGKYILNNLTTGELKHLGFIGRGLGCNLGELTVNLLRKMVQDYDNNPFRYI